MKPLYLLFFGVFLGANALFAQENFMLEKEEDSIKVFLKSSPDCDVKTFKATAKINATPEEIVAVIFDIRNNHRWIDGISAGEMIDSVNAKEFYYRQRIPLPFPYQNREIVQHVVLHYLPDGRVKIEINEANEKSKPLDGFVRMKISHGYWLLKALPSGTWVEYVFVADPGENIPAWLINFFLVESPFKTLKQLNKYVATN